MGGHWSHGYVSYSFPNLEAKIPFCGALLAGSGWEKDEWACIHPAEAFYRVFELTFEEGVRLSGIFDRTAEARALDNFLVPGGEKIMSSFMPGKRSTSRGFTSRLPELAQAFMGSEHHQVDVIRGRLADLFEAWGRPERAATFRR
jgi:hypothetical protein